MKRLLQTLMIVGLFALTTTVFAQEKQQSQKTCGSSDYEPVVIENGSILYAELSKGLDAKKAKAGDPITAVLTADVLSHGEIIIPRNSKLIGHVSEAKPSSKEDPESRLGIVFEKAILKGGHEVSFSSVLITLRPPKAGPSMGEDIPSVETQRNTPIIGARPASRRDRLHPSITGDSQAKTQSQQGSEIAGLNLVPSGTNGTQTIVSQKHTVKLESGVNIELQVTGKY
jgi:hypothetical protein